MNAQALSVAAVTTHAIVARLFDVDVVPGIVTINRGRAGLRPLLREMSAHRGAEVGVWKGRHAQFLCAEVPDLTLHAVDSWDTYAEYDEQKNDASRMAAAFLEAQQRLRPYRCTVVRMPSVRAAATIPAGSLDFVYIDANHRADYVTADLEAWQPTVRPGGLVSGHDYIERPEKKFIEVKRAVDAFVQTHAIETLFLFVGDKTPSFFWVVS